MCDGQGRPVRLHLTAGQVSDFKGAYVLLADLPDETQEVLGDRGYDSNRIRQNLAERNITACISPKKNRKSKLPYNWHLYKKRHLIENMFAKLKDCDGSQPDMTDAPTPSCPQSISPQASSSISKNES
ncbi:transposase [Acetobacter oeni LMG 21952]|nr:transposase [Acetobacter oeni]NHO20906.1 transposase [Acetobacter oeni]GBR10222.1 transposase [Acetobacter oeni LMG 21952]